MIRRIHLLNNRTGTEVEIYTKATDKELQKSLYDLQKEKESPPITFYSPGKSTRFPAGFLSNCVITEYTPDENGNFFYEYEGKIKKAIGMGNTSINDPVINLTDTGEVVCDERKFLFDNFPVAKE